jgi:hypothetical protein
VIGGGGSGGGGGNGGGGGSVGTVTVVVGSDGSDGRLGRERLGNRSPRASPPIVTEAANPARAHSASRANPRRPPLKPPPPVEKRTWTVTRYGL